MKNWKIKNKPLVSLFFQICCFHAGKVIKMNTMKNINYYRENDMQHKAKILCLIKLIVYFHLYFHPKIKQARSTEKDIKCDEFFLIVIVFCSILDNYIS